MIQNEGNKVREYVWSVICSIITQLTVQGYISLTHSCNPFWQTITFPIINQETFVVMDRDAIHQPRNCRLVIRSVDLVTQSQIPWSSSVPTIYLIMMYLFNCNWVDAQWQQYSSHLHTNSTQNTQNGNSTWFTVIKFHVIVIASSDNTSRRRSRTPNFIRIPDVFNSVAYISMYL
jgi:hypothetical protein